MTEDMGILRRFRLITLTKVIFNIYLSSGPKAICKGLPGESGRSGMGFLLPDSFCVCVCGGVQEVEHRTPRTYQANVPPLSYIPSQRQVLFSFLILLSSE